MKQTETEKTFWASLQSQKLYSNRSKKNLHKADMDGAQFMVNKLMCQLSKVFIVS